MERSALTLVRIVLGRDQAGLEVSDQAGTLTAALIEVEAERRRWWRPWLRLEVDGYEDPWK